MDTFGRKFIVSIFGESHGNAVGVVLDGVRPGMPLAVEDFMADIRRRKSGAAGTTPRIEADEPEILSGVYEGHTTGAPLTVIFRNGNTRSGDYSQFRDIPRPGHADYVAGIKWHDFNDPRGGGHFSGRLTLPVVAAGVVAKKMCGCSINAVLTEIGGVSRDEELRRVEHGAQASDSEIWKDVIDKTLAEKDSVGGIVECTVSGLPAGLGEPFFDSVESLVAHAVFAIPGVRGIEFGDGFAAAGMKGSQHNDLFDRPVSAGCGHEVNAEVTECCTASCGVSSKNGAGGINGGITNGNPLVFRVAFKPTSSIGRPQRTFNFASGQMTELEIPGRHDVCFALRTPPVVEAMAAIVLADLMSL